MKFFSNLSKIRQWEFYLTSAVLLWSLFPIITILSYSWVDHIFSLAWSAFFACIFFAIILTLQRKWWEIFKKNIWKDLILATLFIWIFFYFFFFWWLSKTTAWNAAVMWLMEIFFAFIYFELFFWEKSPIYHYYWAVFMLSWAVIILFPWEIRFNQWDILILIWTMLSPIWNFYMKKVREKISSTFIMFFRSLIVCIFAFSFAYLFLDAPTGSQLYDSIPFLIIIWFLLLWLSKILWIEGIHKISVPKAMSFNSIWPAFTLVFAFFILGEVPSLYQVLWLIPIVIWWILITRK